MAEAVSALPGFATEGRYVYVDDSRLRAAAALAPLDGESHPALVLACTIRLELGFAC